MCSKGVNNLVNKPNKKKEKGERLTAYKASCPNCAKKDYCIIKKGNIFCKNCGFVVGTVLSDNIEVTLLPTWEDISRWRKTIFKKSK